jgi:predicted ATPase/class 3 adenylate cyclase
VTLLFTDIEGSTRLLQALPDDYGKVLATHRVILRAAVADHGGREFGTEGDASFVAFTDASAAIAAAAEAQSWLSGETWPGGVELRVRMGVHTGTPTVIEDDYVGLDLHRVARICSAANGGQVLVSDQARRSAADPEGLAFHAQGLAFQDLGWHRLKDLERPERLYQLAGPGIPDDHRPPRSLPPVSNLPSVPTSFVGREPDLGAVAELLGLDDVRLVTLTGPGGAGKTRLALESARGLLPRFPDGVFFVPLAAVRDPDRVAPAIADALELHDARGRDTAETVRDHLRDRATLLVLDNFEQVVAGAGFVSELLAAAPAVKVLVTSRAVLSLGGEHEYQVRPLTLPPGAASRPKLLLASDAGSLFAQRARAVKPSFTIDEATAADVAAVCDRLDGLPLAIELAASQLRLLSVTDVRRRLEASLPLPESRSRDLPERQRTLRSTIDWSHELLTGEVQTLFRRLAVFSRGCTLESAEAIAGDDVDVLSGLADLVEHSLVWRDDAAEPARFRMLVTIQQYAAERLERAGEEPGLRRAHAEWFCEQARIGTRELDRPDQMKWLAWFDAEMPNLRAALDWSLAPPVEPGRFEIGAELCRSLGWLWVTHGQTEEAMRYLEVIRNAPPLGPPETLGSNLYYYAYFSDRLGDAELAKATFIEARDLLREIGDTSREASALNALGDLAVRHGRFEEARAWLHEALALVEGSDDPDERHGIAHVSINLADVAMREGDVETAAAHIALGMELMSERGDRWGVAACQLEQSRIAAARHDLPGAYALLAEALAFFRRWEDRHWVAISMEALAMLAAGSGQELRAARLTGAAQCARAAAGVPRSPADSDRLERALAPAREALGAAAWETAEAEGREMTMEQAVDHALVWARGRNQPGDV